MQNYPQQPKSLTQKKKEKMTVRNGIWKSDQKLFILLHAVVLGIYLKIPEK
jgi:hypothetical protein